MTVTFADDATISLAGTLTVKGGVTVDTSGHHVTLDAHHSFRALETAIGAGEGPRVVLRGLTVTGGRSTPGGAGLYTNSVRVMLDQTTWTDNVSGGAGGGSGSQSDGGAVAAPYTDVTVTGSTFTDNHASAGVGGAVAATRVTMTNSTLVDDTGAPGHPDGVSVSAPYGGHLSHVTVLAGGVAGSQSGLLQVTNSLVIGRGGSGAFECTYVTDGGDEYTPLDRQRRHHRDLPRNEDHGRGRRRPRPARRQRWPHRHGRGAHR